MILPIDLLIVLLFFQEMQEGEGMGRRAFMPILLPILLVVGIIIVIVVLKRRSDKKRLANIRRD
jgi:hypothetical protein